MQNSPSNFRKQTRKQNKTKKQQQNPTTRTYLICKSFLLDQGSLGILKMINIPWEDLSIIPYFLNKLEKIYFAFWINFARLS